VLSVSPEGKVTPGEVMKVQQHTALSCLRITLSDGTDLRATEWHPLATRKGWTKAGSLVVGQEVKVMHGWQAITSIHPDHGVVRVYDISIAPEANFIANGVIVHNKSVAASIAPSKFPGTWTGVSDGVDFPSFCCMELYADGTGLFSDYFIYRITKWTASESKWPGTYAFHATLESVSGRQKGKMAGAVSVSGIRYRIDFGTDGDGKGYLRQGDGVAELRESMKPYMRTTSQPSQQH
jgi:hypothetical protein